MIHPLDYGFVDDMTGPTWTGSRGQSVDESVYTPYPGAMSESTTIRVSRDTHRRLTDLASSRHESVDETVRRALRALRQDTMAKDLAAELRDDETAWLDAGPR